MNRKMEFTAQALTLLEKEGRLEKVSLRKVAKKCGCAHTNLYNYFPSLEALKWAMVEEALGQLKKFCLNGSEIGESDPLSAVRQFIRKYTDFAVNRPVLYKLIWITDLDPACLPKEHGFLGELPELTLRLVQNAFPESPKEELSLKTDTAHSYLHGKLLNLIFGRIPPKNRESEISAAVERTLLLLTGA